ncbi:hypothetical protein N0M98_06620 [Paenibacillus doosanensis]|uniref:Uncharacterized protein n=1 Tax=Paenibacillus konkukensis TaxID=2020716 RepID=A0ABY4RHW2_9BACL|nr:MULTISPECIES: hypothetical protein [Paenibacillus]MCS7459812.1 hypothetical protein [Paenibacillus doosanensis]UQZ81768.1 hypothetical protein SK3146_00924 [Paenibacillus konkukensis]
MSAHQTEKEKHLQMVYKNNVVVAMDNQKYIVVHSKRSVKPLLPFEISQEVLEQWKRRDNRIAVTDTPYKELFAAAVNRSDHKLEYIADFNDIEFSDE